MEKETGIQKIQPTGLATLQGDVVTPHMKAVYRVNQLRAYPLSEIQIKEWARSLETFEVDRINFLLGEMIKGNIDWDQKKGIQNITSNMKYVKKEGDGFRFDDFTW